ncbi:MAG TPA: Tad domain-containing protein [Candidatus Dormibacteraeota bacterium]|nr:Tad domain-containing protein [Candidatus Dormibacteraeota bacterium]
MSAHGERGQTLPVWAFGSLTVLLLLAFALSYGNMLRWQIRSQNAADAAARGILSIQATQWNEMESDLQAAAVEEYRIRYILQGMLFTLRGEGGCAQLPATGSTSCSAMYANLRQQYVDAVQRYTNDVLLIQRIAAPTFDDQVAAIKTALQQYQQNCGQANGGDCSFDYTLVAATPRVDQYLEDVYADCCNFVVGGGTAANPNMSQNFSPLQIEVVACAKVPSLLPSFFSFTAPTYAAIGRAAATTIQTTQEFMYVGKIVNPQTNQPFQGIEYPESPTNQPLLSDNDLWYRVDYGGNPATSDGVGGFTYSATNEGLLTALGWWSSIPVRPFAGTLQMGVSFQCK